LSRHSLPAVARIAVSRERRRVEVAGTKSTAGEDRNLKDIEEIKGNPANPYRVAGFGCVASADSDVAGDFSPSTSIRTVGSSPGRRDAKVTSTTPEGMTATARATCATISAVHMCIRRESWPESLVGLRERGRRAQSDRRQLRLRGVAAHARGKPAEDIDRGPLPP